MATETNAPRTVIKRVDKAILWSDGTMTILDVRASYPHVFHPYKGKDGKIGKFSIVCLMPKTKVYFPAKDLIRDHIKSIMQANKVSDLKADAKFMRDGDLAAKPEYEGMYTINASETRRPSVRDNRRDPNTGKPAILKVGEDEDRIYPGCWINCLIRPWWQDNDFGKKVNAGLVGVQFVRDDESFGQGRISDEEIDETFVDFTDESSGYELGEDEDL